MEIRKDTIQVLDHISLAEIFSFLSTSDILLHLSLTCKDFHKTITTSPYILKSLFENLFGRKLTKNEMFNLTYPRFREFLMDIFAANTLHEPLPFLGFRGNCGCDEGDYSYLFDKIFEIREERAVVCTDAGENFDIEGVLSKDYARETKYIQNIILAINQTDPVENPRLHSLKGLLQRYGSWAVDLFYLGSNAIIAEKIKPLKELRREISNYLQDKSDNYHIELPCQKMMNSIGLIRSCHLKREVKGLTCPVKTLAAFASLNEEISPSSIPSLFVGCKTSDDLIQLLKDHKSELPSISQTSIRKIAESSPAIKYINEEEEDGVEFAVFNSNGKKQDVIPLFWVNFKKAIDKDLFLNFRDCSFSGRYVMLKLIQCVDLREGSNYPDSPKNIDMRFCCFYGPYIDL